MELELQGICQTPLNGMESWDFCLIDYCHDRTAPWKCSALFNADLSLFECVYHSQSV